MAAVLQSPLRSVPTLRGRRLPRRLVQLYAGLVLYGVSMAPGGSTKVVSQRMRGEIVLS